MQSTRVRRAVNEGVVVGAGAATRDLPALVDECGGSRVALITTGSVVRSGLAEVLAAALGNRVVATFNGSRPHTPRPVVVDAARVAADARVDALVSFGGSSVVDLTKGVALLLAHGDENPTDVLDRSTVEAAGPLTVATVPHIAVPTTLSAAEFTAAAGITNPETGVKEIFVGDGLAARWVVLDAQVAEATPDRLWAGTGMKLVADCLEGLLSPRATLYARALLRSALATLLSDLAAPAEDLAARGRCLEAAHLALSNLHNVGIGAVGALRHQLGGGCGVPHGEASTIVLPHVMRWNAETAGEELDAVAELVGERDHSALIGRIEATIGALGLPSRLSDVGVTRDDLAAVAEHAASEVAARRNIRPASAADLLSILEQAY